VLQKEEMMKRITALSWLMRRVRNLKPLLYVALCILLTLLICALFKYVFIDSCIGQVCPSKNGDMSGPIFGIGGIFFTAMALLPVFWVDSKLKDAKEEVRREVAEDVRKEVVDLVKAQLLLFRVHYDSKPGQLLADEGYIQDAVSLCPDIKKQEYPLLGERFTRTALELNSGAPSSKVGIFPTMPTFSDAQFPSSTLYPSETFYPIDLETSVKKAIFYLEESLTYSEAINRELLFCLACMYGFYPDRYEEMIRYIEKAIHLDDYVKEDFAHYQALAMLSRSCNRDRYKLERIGTKIGVELPLTEAGFLKALQAIDYDTAHGHYINGYVIKKTVGLSKNEFYHIKISLVEKNGKDEAATAISYQEPTRVHENFFEDKEPPIPLEDLYDRMSKQFYLIALKNK
jgi:hypothetical protein